MAVVIFKRPRANDEELSGWETAHLLQSGDVGAHDHPSDWADSDELAEILAKKRPVGFAPWPEETPTQTYTIPVCPKCLHGPLVFDPDGLDAAEGMYPRAKCKCGDYVLQHEATMLSVVAEEAS